MVPQIDRGTCKSQIKTKKLLEICQVKQNNTLNGEYGVMLTKSIIHNYLGLIEEDGATQGCSRYQCHLISQLEDSEFHSWHRAFP